MSKFITIELDRVRNIKLGHKAMSNLEKIFNKSISNLMQDLGNLKIEEYNKILCIGLQHEDKELTSDKIMDLVDEFSDTGTVFAAVTEAFQESMKPLIEMARIREAQDNTKEFVASKNA